MYKEHLMRMRFMVLVLACTLLLSLGLAEIHRMSLPAAVAEGRVFAEMHGTGGSTGDAVTVEVSRADAGREPLHLTIPAGTRLGASNGSDQGMVVAGIAGRVIDSLRYTPANEIIVDLKSKRSPSMYLPAGSKQTSLEIRSLVAALQNNQAQPPHAAGPHLLRVTRGESVVYVLEAYCVEFA